jgi:hypothetical protein
MKVFFCENVQSYSLSYYIGWKDVVLKIRNEIKYVLLLSLQYS